MLKTRPQIFRLLTSLCVGCSLTGTLTLLGEAQPGSSIVQEFVQAVQKEKELGHGRRLALQMRIVNAGAASVDPLVGLLAHEDSRVRAVALSLLQEIGKQFDEDPLIVQLYLVDGLDRSAAEARDQMTRALVRAFVSDPAADIRRMAGFSLVHSAPGELIPHLADILRGGEEARLEETVPILLNLAEQTMMKRLTGPRTALIRSLLECVSAETAAPGVLEPVLRALGMMRAKEGGGLALRTLSHPEASLRAVAAFALGEFEAPSLALPLAQRLASERDGRVQQVILTGLARLKSPEAGPPLLEFARANSASAAAAPMAIEALAECGFRPACPWLRQAVSDPRSLEDVTDAAALALAKLGDAEAGAPLLEAFGRRPSPAILAALGELREERAVPFMLKLLRESTSVNLRLMAAVGLGHIADASAAASLIEALEQDEDERVRGQCAIALGRLRAGAGRAALEKALAQDETVHVRAYAAFALGDLGNPDSCPALRAALESTENQRSPDKIVLINAAAALLRLGDAQPVGVLHDQTRSHHPWNRQNALIALGLTRHPSARAYILRGLKDAHPMVRHAAVTAAGDLGDASLVPDLESARGDLYFQHDYHHGFRGYMVDMKIDEIVRALQAQSPPP
ncbi:MAG: HEAT repeat domain-containing protein [Planctomycetes bacterium]|nr:HEAT repeat domain-containing protein [Planctomycetota bacterium]